VFTNIELRDSRVTNSGTGDSVNGVGITIKSRDDGANGPTSLTGVTLDGNTITGNQLGLRLGETGKSNVGPTNVHVNRNNISGNVNGAGMTNVSQTTADAACNWWGSSTGPSGQGGGSGDSVGTGITFTPFLLTNDLQGGCRPPVAVGDVGTTAEDTPLVVPAAGVLTNDSDPESRPLTAVKVTDPAHGTVSLNSNGGYTYTPAADYNGPDSFTYKANDGSFDSNVVTVALTVTPVNDAPVAMNDIGTVAEDGSLTKSAAAGVLGNDTDAEGQPLTAAKVTDPAHGTLSLNSNGGYTYTPAANYNGPDSFTYKANDGTSDSNFATVAITVTPVNDAPVAANDTLSVHQDGTLTGAAPGILGNDTDADGQPITAAKVTDPVHGAVTLRPDGSYEYTPAAGYSGPDSFTYKASDGSADSNVATANITVIPGANTPGGPPEDTTPPVFVSLSLTNTTFRVNPTGAAETIVVARAKKGTAFVYSLSEAARVLFTIEVRTAGRKVGTTCRKTSQSNRSRPHCTRFVSVGRFAQNSVKGANRKTFSGKVGTKTLTPGSYRTTLWATDAAGNRSAVARATFRVVR
jgi:VCBS repeat-containing protein